MTKADLKVTRKGFWRKRGKDRYGHLQPRKWIKGTSYFIKDRGKPGRGLDIIPSSRNPGAMTEIAYDMGYNKVTDIKSRDIQEFCQKLVKKYGKKSSLGMARRQLTYRKNLAKIIPDGTSVKFFQTVFNLISKSY